MRMRGGRRANRDVVEDEDVLPLPPLLACSSSLAAPRRHVPLLLLFCCLPLRHVLPSCRCRSSCTYAHRPRRLDAAAQRQEAQTELHGRSSARERPAQNDGTHHLRSRTRATPGSMSASACSSRRGLLPLPQLQQQQVPRAPGDLTKRMAPRSLRLRHRLFKKCGDLRGGWRGRQAAHLVRALGKRWEKDGRRPKGRGWMENVTALLR